MDETCQCREVGLQGLGLVEHQQNACVRIPVYISYVFYQETETIGATAVPSVFSCACQPVVGSPIWFDLTFMSVSLLAKHISINEKKQSISGYRVQIYFGTQRNKANEVKSLFLQKYPEVSTYIIYQQPNFKVRIGDFYTRLEALKFYQKISSDFGNAFIIKDDIKLSNVE